LSNIERTHERLAANLEQALTADLGLFARASWSPGKDEIIGWTDVDESVSLGAALKGRSWGGSNDTVGVAGSPKDASSYLAGGTASKLNRSCAFITAL
jgi:high affinity Mn2+ porin